MSQGLRIEGLLLRSGLAGSHGLLDQARSSHLVRTGAGDVEDLDEVQVLLVFDEL